MVGLLGLWLLLLDFIAGNIATHSLKNVEQNKQNTGEIRIYSPVYHHTLDANRDEMLAWVGDELYSLRTNSFGFRDRVVRDVPEVSSNYRIVFIGDSFTEGLSVEYDDSFVGIIAKAFKSKGIEVLNAAVVSYSPIIYWRKIKYFVEVVGFKFNELVVFIDISDIEDEVNFRLDEVDAVVDANSPPDPWRPVRQWAVRNFASMRLISTLTHYIRRYNLAVKGQPVPNRKEDDRKEVIDHRFDSRFTWTFDEEAFKTFGARGLKLAAEHMNNLHGILKPLGIRLTVVVYPHPAQINVHDLDSIQVKYWRDWCDANGVQFINLFPRFINETASADVISKYFFDKDIHWNTAGHSLIASSFLSEYVPMRPKLERPNLQRSGLQQPIK